MVEDNTKAACLFADTLIGERQVVVEDLLTYMDIDGSDLFEKIIVEGSYPRTDVESIFLTVVKC